MVQFGPNDYSVSLGKPGQGGLPEVVEAHNKMIKMAIKAGVDREWKSAVRRSQTLHRDGCQRLLHGLDHQIIAGWCRTNGPALRKLLP